MPQSYPPNPSAKLEVDDRGLVAHEQKAFPSELRLYALCSCSETVPLDDFADDAEKLCRRLALVDENIDAIEVFWNGA